MPSNDIKKYYLYNYFLCRFFAELNFNTLSISSYPVPLTEEAWRGRRVTESSIVYRNSTFLPTATSKGQ
jgi:hypothetical protein